MRPNSLHRSGAAAILLGIALATMSTAHAGEQPSLISEGCVTRECHPAIGAARFIHGPVSTGQCTPCHKKRERYTAEKHDKNSFALTVEGKELCLTCHDIMKKTMSLRTNHKAVAGRGCLVCHDPHQSPNKFQLRQAPQIKLCEVCHKKQVLRITKGAFLHGSLKEGTCTPCHNPHASDCPRLYISCDTKDEKAWGNPENAAYVSLCWQCHPKDALLDPGSKRTNFRDGNRNLHELHVLKKRPPAAHPCKRCHEHHASGQPKLLRDDVTTDRGVFSFPIHFKVVGNGGACTVECHRDLAYDRIVPVNR